MRETDEKETGKVRKTDERQGGIVRDEEKDRERQRNKKYNIFKQSLFGNMRCLQ